MGVFYVSLRLDIFSRWIKKILLTTLQVRQIADIKGKTEMSLVPWKLAVEAQMQSSKHNYRVEDLPL